MFLALLYSIHQEHHLEFSHQDLSPFVDTPDSDSSEKDSGAGLLIGTTFTISFPPGNVQCLTHELHPPDSYQSCPNVIVPFVIGN